MAPPRPRRKALYKSKKGSKDKHAKKNNKKRSIRRIEARIARWTATKEQLEAELEGDTAAPRTSSRRAAPVDYTEPVTEPRTKEDEAMQRVAIKYFYRQHGCPPEEDWDGRDGTVALIRKDMLGVPATITVRAVLVRLAEDADADVAALAKRKVKRTFDEVDDLYVALMAVEGYSRRDARDRVNKERAKSGLEPISLQMIDDAEKRAGLIRRRRRTEKMGSSDEQSDWAKGSLNQSIQFTDQLKRGAPDAAVAGPKLRVGDKRMPTATSDPYGMLGKTIMVPGSWWENPMPKAHRRTLWACELTGFYGRHRWEKEGELTTYYIKSLADGDDHGELYAMQADDVYKRLVEAGLGDEADANKALKEAAPAFVLEQVLWLDEKHKKCVLGKVSPYDCKLPTDKDGKHCLPEDGGEYGEWSNQKKPKFPPEVRFLFGVHLARDENGERVGRRIEPFEYTGKWIVGVAAYEAAIKTEIDRANRLKGGGGWGGTGTLTREQLAELEGGRYEARYGDDWRARVEEAIGKGQHALMCVTKLMDHAIEQGNAAFAGTKFADSWLMYHDHLSAWWEAGAQKYLAERGYADRQVRACGSTNEEISLYRNSVVGSRPEMMPLDHHLFDDLEDAVTKNIILTSHLKAGPPDDPCKHGRFDAGTPRALAATMVATWKHHPSSERIVEDIERWPMILEQIVAHKGCVVPDLAIQRAGCSKTKRKRFQPCATVDAAAATRAAALREKAESMRA